MIRKLGKVRTTKKNDKSQEKIKKKAYFVTLNLLNCLYLLAFE